MHGPIDALKHGREDFMAGLEPVGCGCVDLLICDVFVSLICLYTINVNL